MIAKILFEFLIPTLLLGTIMWVVVKTWWTKYFKEHIKSAKEINNKASQYDKMMEK